MLSCVIGKKTINTFKYDKSKLKEWSNKGILKCPECGEKVLYCHGEFKVPYFKHEKNSDCISTYSEPYTEEHINGIKKIYEWLCSVENIKNLEVEKYIKNTKQRPDIYFESGDKRYCIEFQCSPISTQYKKRHELYELEGIDDIWILGLRNYGMFEFIDDYCNDNILECSEIKIKTIEDEIDLSNKSLLYFNVNDNSIYKMNKDGYKGVRRESRNDYDSVLKKTFDCSFIRKNIFNIGLNFIETKLNKDLINIETITNKIILDTEEKINNINKEFEEFKKLKYDLFYNLDNVRVPIFIIKGEYYYYEKIVSYGYQEYIKKQIDDFLDKKVSDIKIKRRIDFFENKLKNQINEELKSTFYNVNYYRYGKNFQDFDVFYKKYNKLFSIDVCNIEESEVYDLVIEKINKYMCEMKCFDNIDSIYDMLENLKSRYSNLKYINKFGKVCLEYEDIKENEFEISLETRIFEDFVIKFDTDAITLENENITYNTIFDLEEKLINILSNKIRMMRYDYEI